MQKVRLDDLMMQRGMAVDRSQAQRTIMAGEVRVDNQLIWNPSTRVRAAAELSVDLGPRYVSRGGEKLDAALTAFGLADLSGRICADVGASTGGFTDCLLQHGAPKVYAIDVGYGDLHWKLRNDARVVVMERTNARYVEDLGEPVRLVSVDASFISLRTLLPALRGWLSADGEVVALIKPQFEASREEVSRGEGVILDPAVHRQVLNDILMFAALAGFVVSGLIQSPLKGPKGNTEFLMHLTLLGSLLFEVVDIGGMIDGVLES